MPKKTKSKKKGNVVIVTLESTSGSKYRYQTIKNQKNTTEKLEANKYDPRTQKHERFVEVKVKK